MFPLTLIESASVELQIESEVTNEGIDSFLLPKAIVQRIIAMNTDNALINKESKEIFAQAATLFISFLTSAYLFYFHFYPNVEQLIRLVRRRHLHQKQ